MAPPGHTRAGLVEVRHLGGSHLRRDDLYRHTDRASRLADDIRDRAGSDRCAQQIRQCLGCPLDGQMLSHTQVGDPGAHPGAVASRRGRGGREGGGGDLPAARAAAALGAVLDDPQAYLGQVKDLTARLPDDLGAV
jgi:hypothetical protein